MSVRSAAVTFVNDGISEEAELLLEEGEGDGEGVLGILKKDDKPKVVEDEKYMVLDENAQTMKLNQSLKLIDEELPL